MADVKLNTLPQSTSPTSTQDLLLFDESTNAGQRINYNTLADVILAKLTSKTYTVGGGTQTLISAIDALNSKLLDGNWKTGIDLNTYKETQTLLVRDATNKPSEISNEIWGSLEVIGRNDYSIQWLSRMGSTWTREYRNSAWTAWVQDPTRAEITALNRKETLNITASTGTWPSEITLHSASYAYRFNNVVMIHLNFKIVSDTKKSLIIEGVLPESMRPNSDVYAMGGDGDTDGICQPFMIRSDGKISMWNTKTGTTYLQADATYIAKSGT